MTEAVKSSETDLLSVRRQSNRKQINMCHSRRIGPQRHQQTEIAYVIVRAHSVWIFCVANPVNGHIAASFSESNNTSATYRDEEKEITWEYHLRFSVWFFLFLRFSQQFFPPFAVTAYSTPCAHWLHAAFVTLSLLTVHHSYIVRYCVMRACFIHLGYIWINFHGHILSTVYILMREWVSRIASLYYLVCHISTCENCGVWFCGPRLPFAACPRMDGCEMFRIKIRLNVSRRRWWGAGRALWMTCLLTFMLMHYVKHVNMVFVVRAA